jgi:integrase
MRKVTPANERIKREYLAYLKEAKGQDESSLDKVAAALVDFEQAIGFKNFSSFHRDWARLYKTHLERRKNCRTGKPISLTTRDATLRLVRTFIEWLSTQSGYRSRISYADAAYFNNNARDARAAHAQRPIPYPSLEQCAHAFRTMPQATDLERRNRAIFAFLILTGARDGATATLRLGHVDIVEGAVFQDGRDVRTKNGKTIETWFFPVDAMYRECLEKWVTHLRIDRLYGPTDALFPKLEVGLRDGRFAAIGLSRAPYGSGQPINAAIKAAFVSAGLQPFTAHSFRKTLAMFGDKVCKSLEEHKAWSQNLGHEHLATTISAYMPVPRERQRELVRGVGSQLVE